MSGKESSRDENSNYRSFGSTGPRELDPDPQLLKRELKEEMKPTKKRGDVDHTWTTR